MVVTLNITDYNVHRVLVDNESLVDVLFYDALLKINILPELLKKLYAPITRFLGELVRVEGTIMLSVIAGSTPRRSQMHLTFTVVKT